MAVCALFILLFFFVNYSLLLSRGAQVVIVKVLVARRHSHRREGPSLGLEPREMLGPAVGLHRASVARTAHDQEKAHLALSLHMSGVMLRQHVRASQHRARVSRQVVLRADGLVVELRLGQVATRGPSAVAQPDVRKRHKVLAAATDLCVEDAWRQLPLVL